MSDPFKKEFKLVIISAEPLGQDDVEMLKDALAQLSGHEEFQKQSWLLVDGEQETDFDEFH